MTTDITAQGLAAGAAKRASQAPLVYGTGGRMGAIYGGAGNVAFFTAASITVPAGTMKGGELMRISAAIAKYLPFNANTPFQVTVGNAGGTQVVVLQGSNAATLGWIQVVQELQVSTDRKWGFCTSINAFNQTAPGVTDVTTPTPSSFKQQYWGLSGPTLNIGARASSATVAFVSYSAPPTIETILVNFDNDVVINFNISVRNTDVAEMVSPRVTIFSAGPAPVNVAPAKTVAIFGDSLIEGSGSTTIGNVTYDYPSQFRRLQPGRPVDQAGLGGQTTVQIVTRVLADPVRGKLWKLVVHAMTNDINTDGPTWWNAIYPYFDQIIAFRGGSANLLFPNLHPRAGWGTASAYYVATQYVNAQLLARYGTSMVVDRFTALASASGQVPVNLYTATASTTGTIGSGSNSLTVTSATGIAVGQYVVSTGSTAISDGSGGTAPTVTAVSGTTITLSANASASLSSAPVVFIASGEVHLNNAGYAVDAATLNSKVTALGW